MSAKPKNVHILYNSIIGYHLNWYLINAFFGTSLNNYCRSVRPEQYIRINFQANRDRLKHLQWYSMSGSTMLSSSRRRVILSFKGRKYEEYKEWNEQRATQHVTHNPHDTSPLTHAISFYSLLSEVYCRIVTHENITLATSLLNLLTRFIILYKYKGLK